MPRKCYSRLYTIPDDVFREYVRTSETYMEILRKCGEEYKNINTVKRRIALFGIDSSHIKNGNDSNRGRVFVRRRVTLDYAMKTVFIENSTTVRCRVKMLIRRWNLIPYRCECGNEGVWLNKPLSLQLDHRNGIPNDNRLTNLRFICPNCHSQTETFSGKKARR
jgi:hypothetical protein